jgi:hypothetical protein
VADADRRTAPILAALGGAAPPVRVALLRVLARLGGEKALAAIRAGLRDADAEVRATAVRELPNWPSPAVANDLLAIAKGSQDLRERVLALRGYVSVIGSLADRPAEELGKMCEAAMAAAPRPEDKKMVLGEMGRVGNLGALRLAERYLDDPALGAEAEAAVLAIARAISGTHQAEAKAALEKLRAATKNDGLRKQAGEVIGLLEKFEDYITAWMASGPYTQDAKDGPGLFDVVFPPERPGAKDAKWQAMPVATDRNRPWLLEFDKTPWLRGNNRAVYLRTRLYSPKKQPARMELGSDDGVKVWLGGKLIHANNTTRPCSPGQDKKDVTLEQGWSELMMKVTQGGGEWSACLRFRAPDGAKLEGLKADPAGQ